MSVARIVAELALTAEPSPHDWRVGKNFWSGSGRCASRTARL
jgi:hypothetical protein